ncbi:MAG: TetR/AcrR family transcriptional regulator [Vicinamibacterales bacterium]
MAEKLPADPGPAVPVAEVPKERSDAPARTPGSASRRVRETLPDPSVSLLTGGADSDAPPLGRRDRRRLETFERLVAAAREELFNRDLSQIAVEDITNAADVGKGTFFNYFASKEQVTTGMLVELRKNFARCLADIESGRVSMPDAYVDRAKTYMCPETGRWLTYEQNLMRGLLSEPVRTDYATQMQAHRQFHRRLMELGQLTGHVRTDITPDDVIQVSQAFSVGSTVLPWIQGIAPTPESVESWMRGFLRVLVAPEPPAALTGTAETGSRHRQRSKPQRARKTARRSGRTPVRTANAKSRATARSARGRVVVTRTSGIKRRAKKR